MVVLVVLYVLFLLFSCQIKDLIKNFDAELRLLRHHKLKADINVKMADLRHVTLFEELLLLKEFEKRENSLLEKVNSRIEEQLEIQVRHSK